MRIGPVGAALEPPLPTEVKMGEIREQYVIDRAGKRAAVLLPIKDYQRLLEDLHDLAVVAERRDKPTISFEEPKRRLRAGQ